MLWLVVILATLAGAFMGGWHSIRLAREGDLAGSARTLRLAAFVAAICGSLLTIPTLGWPFMQESDTVPEVVSKTIEVPKWIFFKDTKTVTETTYRTETRQEFSAGLLIAMAAVGALCYLVEKLVVRLVWRILG